MFLIKKYLESKTEARNCIWTNNHWRIGKNIDRKKLICEKFENLYAFRDTMNY